ncbi:hypothetical protein HYV70_01210 [Candidatus Uhrbacteria bacterium]|nr:hypothetical protein [Candidatus Uhrbacteria bacterium]
MGDYGAVLLMYGAVFAFLFFGWRYTMRVVDQRKSEEEKKAQENKQQRTNRVPPEQGE